ncbi:MAG TPA: DUF748 domain-containing protein, partial [Humidesulfovibrio sp.]|uniref:DUF748 domain-containing protein n=1 Tax=Humidesulfovibrio sp. TaxID=2910988 RepID=UPI002C99B61D
MTEQPAPASNIVEKGKALARHKGLRITLGTLAALFLLFGALGYFWLPGFAKAKLEALLSEEFARPVSVEKIEVSPYTLSATVRGFSVGQKGVAPGQHAGKGPEAELFGFDSLYVNISTASIARGIPVVSEVALKGPRLNLARLEDGKLSVSDLLDKWLAGPSSPTPQFSVADITIEGGSVSFDDQLEGARHEVTELALGIPFIANTSGTVESSVQPKFSAKVDGAALAFSGAVKPFAPGKDASIELNIHDFDVLRVFKYAQASLPFELGSARLDTTLTIAFAKPEGKDAAVRLSGDIALRDADLKLTNAKGQKILLRLGKAGLHLDEATLAGTVHGALSLAELAVRKDGAKEPFLGFGALELTGIKASTAERKAEVGEVKLTKPSASIRRVEGGELDLVAALDGVGAAKPTAKTAPKATAKPAAKPEATPATKAGAKKDAQPAAKTDAKTQPTAWTWRVGRVLIADGGLRYADDTLGGKVKPLTVEALALSVDGLSSTPAPAKVDFSARVNEHGAVKLGGTVQPAPLKAELDLDLKQVDLVALQGFASSDLNAVLTRGEISLKGRLNVDPPKAAAPKTPAKGAPAKAEPQAAEAPAASFKGDVALIDFSVLDKANSADLLRWRSLKLTGLDAGSAPLRVGVDEINLSSFFVRLLLTPEGHLNLNDVMKKEQVDAAQAKGGKPATAKSAETKQADTKPVETKPVETKQADAKKAGPAPDIRIGRIVLSGGGINFTDRFVKPNYTANLTDLNGRIGALKAGTLTDIAIRGKVDRTGPLDISGKADPLGPALNVDIRAKATGIEMSGFTPYSGRYVGYVIEKGKLSVDVHYTVKDGQLAAENNIFLDQLTFGKKVDSPNALSIPVGLVVALLKNSRGEIDINLPIKGSLSDPEFSIGGVIVKVLLNLITKAATSPFTLLASLFGGGEELSYVAFEPGQNTLTPEAEKHLDTLAKALRDRTGLKLELAGGADPAREEDGLKRARMVNKIKAQKATELARQGKTSGGVAEISLTPEEYAKYLE